MTFGTRCLNMRLEERMPVASCAIMNSCSLRERICPRTSLAMPAQPNTPSATIIQTRRTYGSILSASNSAPIMMSMG